MESRVNTNRMHIIKHFTFCADHSQEHPTLWHSPNSDKQIRDALGLTHRCKGCVSLSRLKSHADPDRRCLDHVDQRAGESRWYIDLRPRDVLRIGNKPHL